MPQHYSATYPTVQAPNGIFVRIFTEKETKGAITDCQKFRSGPSLVHSGNQSADHFGDDFDSFAQIGMRGILDESLAPGEFQQRDAFLGGRPGNDEEIRPVIFGESAIAFGEICRDGNGCPVQLVAEEVIAARQGFGQSDDAFGKIERLLIDLKILEKERHSRIRNLSRRQVNR